MRKAGILMPVASLPNHYGNGDFGPDAYKFIDLAAEAGMEVWQILPLNLLGYGNSPYQPYSTYAMDEIYLSLEMLQKQGLLKTLPERIPDAASVDYDQSRKLREKCLREAYRSFKPDLNYMVFSFQDWVRHFALFMTFRKKNHNKCWIDWKEEMKNQPVRQDLDLKPYQDEILFQVFVQYELYLQWQQLKQYANDHGISIMGDLPFYVGLDSADVWSHRSAFLLDKDGRPTFVAGVPPDYFSEDGQRWGNPIYNWPYLKKTEYTFWTDRLAYAQKLYDTIRLDHFRAFDTYWKIPASCPTARVGKWVEAPGYELFDHLLKKVPDIHIVAEDLGDLRAQVLELRDHYSFRGMRIIQFSFNPDGMKKDQTHLLVYTGTHDNPTIRQWYQEQPEKQKKAIRQYFRKHGYLHSSFCDNMIDYAMDSRSDLVILPMADYLRLSKEGRINTPGTVGSPNWEWHLKNYRGFASRVQKIHAILEESGRIRKRKTAVL